jgi:RTX calcium-binding nonapeptide repeat (4 copies)
MSRRLAGAVAAVGALCVLAPIGSAAAATSIVGYVDFRFGSVLTVHGDKLDNDIALEVDSGVVVVSDDRPLEISFGDDCVHETPTEVRCDLPLDDTVIDVFGARGADRVRIGSGLPYGANVHGGGQRDVLVGGDAHDLIVGGRGRDMERGGPGDDTIGVDRESTAGGDPGRDTYSGGRGDDSLRATDGRRDARLGCGRGNDVVFKDRRKDPHPIKCEEVNRKGTSAPSGG